MVGRTVSLVPTPLRLRRSPAHRSRHSARRTGAPGSPPGGSAATRSGRRRAAGSVMWWDRQLRTQRASRQLSLDHPIRIRMQRPTHAGPALAGRWLSARARVIRLLTLGGRLGGLSGVFAGRVSASRRASKRAIRASCAAIRSCAAASCIANARISASFSVWLSWLRRGACSPDRWNQLVRAMSSIQPHHRSAPPPQCRNVRPPHRVSNYQRSAC